MAHLLNANNGCIKGAADGKANKHGKLRFGKMWSICLLSMSVNVFYSASVSMCLFYSLF